MSNIRFTSVDLFAGAGGVTEGFRQAGFKCLFANDHEEPALETFAKNHPEVNTSSTSIIELSPLAIRAKLGLQIGELDVLVGGPPCQGFSTYGRRDPKDDRNQLYNYYLDFLSEFLPKTFVMENVIGILSFQDGAVIKDIIERAENLGYAVTVNTLDAASFGVPQFRRRVFILGSRQGVIEGPIPTHWTGDRSEKRSAALQGDFFQAPRQGTLAAVTVRDAISDLPEHALVPKQTHQEQAYQSVPATEYQREMRGKTTILTHHSAKQMLGIRKLRLALMRPGDYGTMMRARLHEGGLPADIIDELLSGGGNLRDMEECRTEDRKKEIELRRLLSQGHIDIDKVLESLDSGGFANKYRRLDWNQPSHTIVAHMARDCSDFVHPGVDRFLSTREAARLQSFPDSYYFCGSQFSQFRQIGNAVPPKLANAIAKVIAKALKDSVYSFSALETRNFTKGSNEAIELTT